ncbi:MAG: hypothetical protein ACRDTA_04900 [Pseudonocardiaceae bacterium]
MALTVLREAARLERLATLAGLAVTEVDEVVCPFRYPEEITPMT